MKPNIINTNPTMANLNTIAANVNPTMKTANSITANRKTTKRTANFLNAISKSFEEFIKSGSSRSTAKLKPLHGAIANDIATLLGSNYSVYSQGYGKDKEEQMKGRYMEKKVDIVIKRGENIMAGIAVKFVMQNYSQNSNNYFENMLGETANIRCNNYPYFQIFIIPDELPYYDDKKKIKHWETFSAHNIDKYTKLSHDNPLAYMHTPNKTLLYVVKLPKATPEPTNKTDYFNYYATHIPTITISGNSYSGFSNSVILNNYDDFIEKVCHTILAI